MRESEMKIQSKAIVLGDHIDSERLHPARYFSLNEKIIKNGLFQGMTDQDRQLIGSSSIIIAGRNFGCGSSREVIVKSLLFNDIKIIIADSFARIFFRNAVNLGLITIECPGLNLKVDRSDLVTVDVERGTVINESKRSQHSFRVPDDTYFRLLSKSQLSNIIVRSQA